MLMYKLSDSRAMTTARKAAVLAAIMAAAAGNAAAQKEKGDIYIIPQAGINVSHVTGYDVYVSHGAHADKMSSSGKTGFLAGCEAEYMLAAPLGVRLGAFYSVQGDKIENLEEGGVKTSLKYLCVPLTASVYLNGHIGLSAGIQYARLLGNSAEGAGAEVIGQTEYGKNDISIPVGASLEYRDMTLSLKYLFGLTKVNGSLGDTRNRSLWVTLGYRISM